MTLKMVLRHIHEESKRLNSISSEGEETAVSIETSMDGSSVVEAKKDPLDLVKQLPSVLSKAFDSMEDMGSEMAHFVMSRDPRDPNSKDPFADGGGVEIELNEGDMLFLPAGWWHQIVSHEGQHIAINYWWRPPGWQNMFRFEQELLVKLLQQLKEDEWRHSLLTPPSESENAILEAAH